MDYHCQERLYRLSNSNPFVYKLCHVKAGVNRLIFSLFLVDDLVYVSQIVFGCS